MTRTPKFVLHSLVAFAISSVAIAAGADGIGRVLKHTAADGQVSSAIVLKGASLPKQTITRQHVILVDTSASQVGEHRRQALSLLESLLKALPESDVVRLFAADLQAEPLDDGFHQAQGREVEQAIAKLKSRVPLGATNLEGVLRTALLSAGDKPADITYIGDGLSTADLVEVHEIRALVGDLRKLQVPVHSFGVGPQRNLQVLGILALQTGGVVMFDAEVDSSDERVIGDNPKSARVASEVAREQGKALAAAIKAPIFFPIKLQVTPEDVSLLPSNALPIRSDRDSIYLFDGALPANCSTVMTDDSDETISWKLPASVEQPAATFLPTVIRQVKESRGLTNPMAGMLLFRLTQKDFTLNVTAMAQRGMQAVQQGDLVQARKILDMLVPLEPNSQHVKDLAKAIETVKASEAKPTKPGIVIPKKP